MCAVPVFQQQAFASKTQPKVEVGLDISIHKLAAGKTFGVAKQANIKAVKIANKEGGQSASRKVNVRAIS